MMFDLIIVGGGPAGAAAAVYAARKQLKTVLIVEDWGGQSTVSSDIQNWIGTTNISGNDLAANLRKHVEANAGTILKIKKGSRAVSLAPFETHVEVTTSKGEKFEAKKILIEAGE